MTGGIMVSVCDNAFQIKLKLFGDNTEDGIMKSFPFSLSLLALPLFPNLYYDNLQCLRKKGDVYIIY